MYMQGKGVLWTLQTAADDIFLNSYTGISDVVPINILGLCHLPYMVNGSFSGLESLVREAEVKADPSEFCICFLFTAVLLVDSALRKCKFRTKKV